jgi:hypothetical protein
MTEQNPASCADVACGERIDVTRIKLLTRDASAIVSELRTADILVLKWTAEPVDRTVLDFEVMFADGCALCGQYAFSKRRKAKPSLSRLVRLVFKAWTQLPQQLPDGIRFLKAPTADVAHYAIHGY